MNTASTATSRFVSPHQPARGILGKLLAWGQLRQQRLDLADLDAKGLADIGVNASEARKEVRKPFWMMPGFH